MFRLLMYYWATWVMLNWPTSVWPDNWQIQPVNVIPLSAHPSGWRQKLLNNQVWFRVFMYYISLFFFSKSDNTALTLERLCMWKKALYFSVTNVYIKYSILFSSKLYHKFVCKARQPPKLRMLAVFVVKNCSNGSEYRVKGGGFFTCDWLLR